MFGISLPRATRGNRFSSATFAGTSTFTGPLLSNAEAIGYTVGAGGVVTQATSKDTGVTLSEAVGEITMNAASLAANTTVSFTLTNTLIGANDLLVLNHASGGTVGAYALNAQTAAGSAVINVRNLTAGALLEAVVIRFAIIKGAAS